MPITVLVGAQWGDEGKGKVIDVLAEKADWVVRYQGGSNAGHTVKVGDDKYVLHLIPSGILHEGKRCIIGNGVVVDLVALAEELEGLHRRGIATAGRLFVSDRAHLVFPYHRELDEAREGIRGQAGKIGTTKRGIGPCYAEKMSRTGLRACDLLGDGFAAALEQRVEEQNRILRAMDARPLQAREVVGRYLEAGSVIRPYVADTTVLLNGAIAGSESVLFEGAQGTMLDIDHGTYPFVTSSSATAGGACTGAGVAPHRIDRVIGVVKAYTTRVGEGPFPTEQLNETGALLREEGNEFGATTGRPRRCGWFDAVVARYSVMINGIDSWAVTKLDVLDPFATIKICTAYEYDGRRLADMPASARILERCKPVYEEVPGWRKSTKEVTRFADLPEQAKAYLRRLEQVTGVGLGILSVGPRRCNTIMLH